MVECSYCNGKYPVYQIDIHERNCGSNSNEGGEGLNIESMQQLLELLGNGNSNSNEETNRNGGMSVGIGNGGNGLNSNFLEALLRARAAVGGSGNGNGLSLGGQMDQTQQLLFGSLFPALKSMEKGLKTRDLKQFPTERFNK